jgi:hypothetical protein
LFEKATFSLTSSTYVRSGVDEDKNQTIYSKKSRSAGIRIIKPEVSMFKRVGKAIINLTYLFLQQLVKQQQLHLKEQLKE